MQDLFIKICGITNAADARLASSMGANAIGFIFYRGSERYIAPDEAAGIIKTLPEHITKVGLFVHESMKTVREISHATGLSAVQLIGDYAPDDLFGFETSIIKVFRVGNAFDPASVRPFVVDAYLLDTHKQGRYGGTGESFDWNIAVKVKEYGKVILSGGLNPDNIEEAIRFVRPYGVDVSSGVESRPGKKHPDRLRDFIARARSAHQAFA